jgi:hypothetical protein
MKSPNKQTLRIKVVSNAFNLEVEHITIFHDNILKKEMMHTNIVRLNQVTHQDFLP